MKVYQYLSIEKYLMKIEVKKKTSNNNKITKAQVLHTLGVFKDSHTYFPKFKKIKKMWTELLII